MKFGIIREGKVPPDARVALSPEQCAILKRKYNLDIVVESSPSRCFKDSEYLAEGINVSSDISDCEVLIGIKEVPIKLLVPNKTYIFFSHTIKKQPYNRVLLQAILEKNIRFIDYEVIKNQEGERLIAFGYYAGVVGAHNGMMTLGRRTGLFELPQMHQFRQLAEAKAYYKTITIPPVRILITGTGRVASGAIDTLRFMGIPEVSHEEYLENRTYSHPVFTVLSCMEYVKRKDGEAFTKDNFYANPTEYTSNIQPYLGLTDVFINCIFWHKQAPVFFTEADMRQPWFRPEVIADITCDIAPDSSVPSTIRASSIESPIYRIDKRTNKEVGLDEPISTFNLDVMAIDNLPSELPIDASCYFGSRFMEVLIPEFLGIEDNGVLARATMTENKQLASSFAYLQAYAEGKE